MPPSARGAGGNELALLRSENAALRAQLASTSRKLPPSIDASVDAAKAKQMAREWAIAAQEARAAVATLEAKAKEFAAFARELENAERAAAIGRSSWVFILGDTQDSSAAALPASLWTINVEYSTAAADERHP